MLRALHILETPAASRSLPIKSLRSRRQTVAQGGRRSLPQVCRWLANAVPDVRSRDARSLPTSFPISAASPIAAISLNDDMPRRYRGLHRSIAEDDALALKQSRRDRDRGPQYGDAECEDARRRGGARPRTPRGSRIRRRKHRCCWNTPAKRASVALPGSREPPGPSPWRAPQAGWKPNSHATDLSGPAAFFALVAAGSTVLSQIA